MYLVRHRMFRGGGAQGKCCWRIEHEQKILGLFTIILYMNAELPLLSVLARPESDNA